MLYVIVLNYEMYYGATFILQNFQIMNLIVLHAKIRCLNTPVQTDQTFFISPYLFSLITYLFQIRKLLLLFATIHFSPQVKEYVVDVFQYLMLHW